MSFIGWYMRLTERTAVYPDANDMTPEAVVYVALGLAGEVGEVSNQVKKIIRDDEYVITEARHAKLVDELGDVFWYAFRLADELNVTVEEVLSRNAKKLTARKESDTIKGDKRDE